MDGADAEHSAVRHLRRCVGRVPVWLVVNKTDLLPYLDFDRQLAIDTLNQIHPHMPVFEVSAKTEEGFEPWLAWLREVVRTKIPA